MEMKRIRDAFKLYHGNPEELIAYQEITSHCMFDIKLSENFRCKAQLVADEHKTETPSHVTYSSVVARDSVREVMSDFKFKKDAIEPPEIYLGARLQAKDLNGRKVWTMSSQDYTKAIIANLEERLTKKGQ